MGASFNTDNMGVGALTAGTIQAILQSHPGATIVLMDYSKESSYCYYNWNGRNNIVETVNIRFSKNLLLKNHIAYLLLKSCFLKLIPFHKIKQSIISKDHYLKTIKDSDIVAAISGGDSFSDIYGLQRFIYISLPQLLAIFLKKTIVLLPQTIGPFKNKIVRIIAKYILNKSKSVYMRDLTNKDMLERLMDNQLNERKFRFCYDVAFVLEPKKPNSGIVGKIEMQRDASKEWVGINISGLLSMGGYTKKNMFSLKIDYNELIRTIICTYLEKENVNVIVIPHVFGDKENVESDVHAGILFYEEYKDKYQDKLFNIEEKYDQNEIKYIIGMCDFFIGSRMHACIAALSQGVPTAAIAYSDKFYGVMSSIDFAELVSDPRTMNISEIMLRIDSIFRNRKEIKIRLQKMLPGIKHNIYSVFQDIL